MSGSTPLTVSLQNFSPSGVAQVWQLTSSNAIARLSDVNFSGSSFSVTVPSQSITLLVVSSAGRVVTLRWTDTSNNETAFSVERAPKAKTLVFAIVGSIGANDTTWRQTVEAGQWVFRVRASNAIGNSP